ncbi:S-methyl thiohydantoin desulfurase domain-containing protein [Aliamphritea spongicola]|nr:DUF917 family protein [Aliamphritea spongicola]
MDDRGNRYRVQVENESLLVLREDLYGQWQPIAMAPDLICYLCSNGDTITNAELATTQAEYARQGKPLMLNLFVLPVPDELNTAHFRKLCMDELATIGWPQSKIVSPFADYPETDSRGSEGLLVDVQAIHSIRISQQNREYC